jgi:FkbM family methyltransferase
VIVRDLDKEEKEAKKSFRFLRDETGRALLDCGANVGFVSEWMIGKFKRIYAVEAHPETFKRLEKRMARYPSVVPIHASVGAPGAKQLFISSPRNSTGAIVTEVKRKKQPGWYVVAGRPMGLDALLRKTKADVVKLDIEGCEYGAILSSEFRGVKTLVVEYHGTRGAKRYQLFRACDKRLRSLGFKRTAPKTFSMLPDGSALRTFYFVAKYER